MQCGNTHQVNSQDGPQRGVCRTWGTHFHLKSGTLGREWITYWNLSPLNESSCCLTGKNSGNFLSQVNIHMLHTGSVLPLVFSSSQTSWKEPKLFHHFTYLWYLYHYKFIFMINYKSGSFSSYCGKSFKSSEGRKLCEGKCSGNNPIFECPTCSKKLTNKPRLLAHMKTHTGERNIGCPFPGCTSAYYTKTNLTTHIKLTHKLVPKEVFAKYGPPLSVWSTVCIALAAKYDTGVIGFCDYLR